MGKINLEPSEDFLDAQDLGALIYQWLATRSVDAKTLTSYRRTVEYFVHWWEQRGPKQQWRLVKSDLTCFEVYLRTATASHTGKPFAWHTRNDALRRLRQMFHWAFQTERTDKDYAAWVPAADGVAPERMAATPEHLARLMLAADTSHMPLRDQAILAMFIGTGIRLGEMVGLRVEHLTLLADESGTAFVTGKRTKANPSGQRVVAFDRSTGRYLVRYMDAMVLMMGPLWLSEGGRPLLRMGVYLMVKRTIGRAGLSDRIEACHDLRRAFATILGLMHPDAPGWADMIRRQLGHKHYRQTATYTLFQADDIREHIVSPLNLAKK